MAFQQKDDKHSRDPEVQGIHEHPVIVTILDNKISKNLF